jgi:hypothetical protein
MSSDTGDWEENFQNGLRILMNPLLGSSSMIESSPSYHRLCNMIDWLNRETEFPVYWHVLWPEYDDDDARYAHKFENTEAMARIHNYDNVELIRSKFHATQTVDMEMCTRELRETINMGEGQRFFDAIWNDKPPAANFIMDHIGMSRAKEEVLPPIINEMQIVPREDKSIGKYGQLRHVLGNAGPSTHTLYERDAQRQLMTKQMRKFMNGTAIQDIQERSSAQPPGLNTDRLDKVIEANKEGKQDDPVLIHYGSKIYSQRNYEEAWEIADTLLSSGANAEMQVITPHMSPWAQNSAGEYSDNIDHFNVYTSMTKQEMLEQAAKASIMVDSMGDHFEFNLTLAEVAYLGALPVVADSNWSRHMYPDDYPFRYNGKRNGMKMILYVYKNLEELQEEWIPKLREHFRENLSFERYVREKLRIWNQLREDVTFEGDFYDLPNYQQRFEVDDSRGKAMVECLKGIENEFTMQEYADRYKHISDNDVELMNPLDGRKPIEHVRYYWALKNAGVTDLCNDDLPVMDKSTAEVLQ